MYRIYTKKELKELKCYLLANGANDRDIIYFYKNLIISKRESNFYCIQFNMEPDTGYTDPENYMTFKETITYLNISYDELPLYINENINPINLIVKWRLIKGF